MRKTSFLHFVLFIIASFSIQFAFAVGVENTKPLLIASSSIYASNDTFPEQTLNNSSLLVLNSTENLTINETQANITEDDIELPSHFSNIFSLSEIKKKISAYHQFYSTYVNNLYNHMNSNKDLKNLTIFILTVIGIIGVFIFKAQILDNLWSKIAKDKSYAKFSEKKPLLKNGKAHGYHENNKNIDIFSEDSSSDKMILNASLLNDSLISIKNILNEQDLQKCQKKFHGNNEEFEEESMNIDIEKFLSELNDNKDKSHRSDNSEKRRKRKEIAEINKLGDEILGEN